MVINIFESNYIVYLMFVVKSTFGILMVGVGKVSLVTGGNVAVSNGSGLFELYNINNGQLIRNLKSEDMGGMTEIFVGGKPYLANSYR